MGKEECFKDVEVVTGFPKHDLIERGESLVQTKTEYHTAIAVQKPRDLDRIIEALDKEAQYGGEDFYYSWPVKDKKTGKITIIEGCSIGAAMAIAREWTNCAVPIEVKETVDSFIFRASFVDIEKGFTVSRIYRHKKTEAIGKYRAERWEDMEFQKAQSKAMRNVVLAAVPRWLSSRVLRNAKEAVASGIGREGLDVAKDKAVSFLRGYGVEKEAIENVLGKKFADWTIEDMVKLRGMCRQILNQESHPQHLFPSIETGKETEEPTHKENNKRKPKKKEKEQSQNNEEMSDEELLQNLKKAWDDKPKEQTTQEWWQNNFYAKHIYTLTPTKKKSLLSYIKRHGGDIDEENINP